MTGGLTRFGVLGPLLFERDGERVPVPAGHQRSLLALLLRAHGSPLSRDRLVDELWGGRPPASAISALHVYLSKLRGELGDLLAAGPAGYALDPERYEFDLARFDALVAQAAGADERSGTLAREALALVRGEPLSDVSADGSLADWRRALEEKILYAETLRVESELAAGAAGELVADLELLVQRHPYEERLWAAMILALYRSGRQADALDAHQRVRRLLATELGLEPGESLARLQGQILAQDRALLVDGQDHIATEQPRAGLRSTLPVSSTRLIGRERELAELTQLGGDPDVRLLTLTGPGGVGKTRLLTELALRLQGDYADGAVFVGLEQVTDPALVAAEIAAAIARRSGSEGPSGDTLEGYLDHRRLLLILDNFEHLLPAAVLVAELLSASSPLRVLVSSRSPLRIRGEYVFAVQPLPLPQADDDRAADSPAVQLFLQSARAADRELPPDDAVIADATRICRAVDGLPLAIELAAARAVALTPAQIAEQITNPLVLGAHALRDLPDRQQTLESTIRWSYELLSDGARELLRKASVFLGGFTESAVAAVADRPIAEDLHELITASLLRRIDHGARFGMLELVRAFAGEQLRLAAEERDVRRRHRRHFAGLVAPASEAFSKGVAPGELAAPLLADHANIRAALEDAIADGDDEHATELALGSRALWFAGMARQEALESIDQLLARCIVPPDAELALLAAAAFLDGWHPGETTWIDRLEVRAVELGNLQSLARAILNRFSQSINGRDREAMAATRPRMEALLDQDVGDASLGWVNYYLALDDYVAGRFAESERRAQQSIELARAAGHEFLLAGSSATALIARSARARMISRVALSETLELVRTPAMPPLTTFALWIVALYAAGIDPAVARRTLTHAERLYASLNITLWPEAIVRDETMLALGITDLAPLLAETPPLDDAAALAQAAAWLASRDPEETAPREPMMPNLGETV